MTRHQTRGRLGVRQLALDLTLISPLVDKNMWVRASARTGWGLRNLPTEKSEYRDGCSLIFQISIFGLLVRAEEAVQRLKFLGAPASSPAMLLGSVSWLPSRTVILAASMVILCLCRRGRRRSQVRLSLMMSTVGQPLTAGPIHFRPFGPQCRELRS
jgi:hypothetical protein